MPMVSYAHLVNSEGGQAPVCIYGKTTGNAMKNKTELTCSPFDSITPKPL